MELTKVELQIPVQMKEYIQARDKENELLRNAMILYPSIKNGSVSHGKVAEILGINKLDLISMYSSMGLSYFDISDEELDEELATYHSIKEVV